jgi:1,4-dihydroxy-2-naphthoate octaprenyltransferase
LILSLLLKSFMVLLLYLAIIILSWQYSRKPLQLSYRRLGEIFIFILFGPALVMGGYFIQARIFPDFKSFMLSIPFGLLTTGILFANEVPDFADDKKAGKLTWVSFTGKKAFILYFLLVFIALLFITLNMSLGYLGPIALFSFLVLFPGLKAAKILKKDFGNKAKLIESSKLTITIQTIVSIILILDMLL